MIRTAALAGTVLITGCSVSEPQPQKAGVVINEIMVKNSSAVSAPGGKNRDFIELYNAGSDTVQLNHYFLSDSREAPAKRNLPLRSLAPGEFAVFYGGSSDEFPDEFLGFSLSSESDSGECVILTDRTITAVDSLFYTDRPEALKKNVSFGRLTDGGTEWSVQKNPTPGKPNND